MARNLVICCDGTGNEFGTTNTNVVRIVRSVATADGSQHVYYDPGIGTFPEPGLFTAAGKSIAEAIDLAFATGLQDKVQRAYAFLMDSWEPGDEVYLFGFSRGAYTVRVLGAFLHLVGLLQPKSTNLLPYAMRLFASLRSNDDEGSAKRKYWITCNDFRRTFGRPVPGASDGHFPIRFLGVWDTVSSVGRAWEPRSFPYATKNPGIRTVRHAISLDERRWFFRQNRVIPIIVAGVQQDVQEVWYPGVHSDVGGGYPEGFGGLWREPFRWIADEAERAGLRFDAARMAKVLNVVPPPASPWLDAQQESLHGFWWLAEFYPKLVYDYDSRTRRPDIGRGRSRFVHDGAVLHWSVVERLRGMSAYDPPALASEFKVRVQHGAATRTNVEYGGAG